MRAHLWLLKFSLPLSHDNILLPTCEKKTAFVRFQYFPFVASSRSALPSSYKDTSLVCVCGHFTAGQKQFQERIKNISEISAKTRFMAHHTPNIQSHDYQFWFGDFNFRIDMPILEVQRLYVVFPSSLHLEPALLNSVVRSIYPWNNRFNGFPSLPRGFHKCFHQPDGPSLHCIRLDFQSA